MEYGLIGFPLKQSFSKIIHDKLNDYNYELYPLTSDELKDFIIKRKFKGINVTIPYKEEVIKYLDIIDDSVKYSGACNTIINNNGILTGYNSDIEGLKYLLKKHNIILKDKIIGILGDGGTSKTARYLCALEGAKKVYFTSRKNTYESITIEELINTNIEILINTTPVGMYPDLQQSPMDISTLTNLEVVIDVIYNPLKTHLVLQAEKLNLQAYNGLEMLVAQAVFANALFTNKPVDEENIKALYFYLMSTKKNIVLIGMPMSGKSSVGKALAPLLDKEFVDLDTFIEDKQRLTIKEIFQLKGEAHFRFLENNMAKKFSLESDLIISTGGGFIENKENIELLQYNSFIVYLSRDKEKLIYNKKRPLLINPENYELLFNKREKLYLAAMNLRIENNGSIKHAANKIKEAFYENINY